MKRAAHVDSIDALRGLSIFLVLLHHLAVFGPFRLGPQPALLVKLLRGFASSGNWGVHLFLAISGFCLFLPIVGREKGYDWRDFFRRRLIRIMPPYLVALAIAVPISVAMGIAKIDWGDIAAHAFLLHQFVPGINNYNGSFWTLALEFQLYLLLPLFVLLFRKFGAWGTFAGITVLSIAYRAAVWNYFHGEEAKIDRVFGYALPARMPEFVFGMVVASLYVHGTTVKGWLAGVAGLAIVPFAVLAMVVQKEGRFAPLTDAMALIPMGLIAVLTLLGPARVLGKWKPLSGLGLISYSVYLIHQPLIVATYDALIHRGKGAWTAVAGTLAVVMLASVVFYFLIEKPSLKLKNLGRRKPATVPIPPTEPEPEPALSAG